MRLAKAFRFSVRKSYECFVKDVFQTVLIYFYFSPDWAESVRCNYSTMLEDVSKTGYHFTCVFLDCGQDETVYQCGLWKNEAAYEALIDRRYRLDDASLGPFMEILAERCMFASGLIKHTVRRKASAVYIQLVWRSA